MGMSKKDWFRILAYVVPMALSQHPRTAPIANEVSDAIAKVEEIPGLTGQEKLARVVAIAKDAAQATDELRGKEDEVAGVVRDIVDSAVPLVNTIARHAPKPNVSK